MKNTFKFYFLLLALFSSHGLAAQETKQKTTIKPVRLLIEAAFELGGDKVAEVYFTNGNTQSVRAGQGGSLGVGAQFQIPGLDKLLLRSTLGFKYVTTSADNVHIRLTRMPIHLMAHWMIAKNFRIGAGLASHRSIRFKADGIGDDIKFDGATGPMFEFGYQGVGLRYTAMKYKDEFNNSYSANAIGLSFSLTVPNR